MLIYDGFSGIGLGVVLSSAHIELGTRVAEMNNKEGILYEEMSEEERSSTIALGKSRVWQMERHVE